MNKPSISYRPELDGLRAFAVTIVILYHAEFMRGEAPLLSGGFIGVDIFFVISGYLISSLIIQELRTTNQFNYLNFINKRARRLLPALLVTLLMTLLIGLFVYFSPELKTLAKDTVAASLFFSNFSFYFQSIEYGSNAFLNPLLHTWSLSVEEQFYLFAPFLFILLPRKKVAISLIVISVIVILGLLGSHFLSKINPMLSFYLVATRCWELFFGSLIAVLHLFFPVRNLYWGTNRFVPSFGFALLLFSLFYFDGQTLHPSAVTLFPIIGTGLFVLFASNREFIGRTLSYTPIVAVGKLSYSLYLIHYPVFAFARTANNDLTNTSKFYLLILSACLSLACYFMIERPMRRHYSNQKFWWFVGLKLSLVATVVLLILFSPLSNNISRLEQNPSRIGLFDTFDIDYKFGNDGCEADQMETIAGVDFCRIGKSNADHLSYLLIGDSHGMRTSALFDRIGREHNLAGLIRGLNGCPPLLGVYPLRGPFHPSLEASFCYKRNNAALQVVSENQIPLVFLVARWDYYVDGGNSGSLQLLSESETERVERDQSITNYNIAVKRTVSKFNQAGADVIVILQVPQQNLNVSRLLRSLAAQWTEKQKTALLAEAKTEVLLKSDHLKRQSKANAPWVEYDLKNPDAALHIIDPTETFCGELHCAFLDGDGVFYTDNDHATEYGLRRLSPEISKFFDPLPNKSREHSNK